MSVESQILDFYNSRVPLKKHELLEPLSHFTNLNFGLGDTMSLTNLPFVGHLMGKTIHIKSNSPHFKELVKFNPWYESCTHIAEFARVETLQEYNCGNGHFFQRIQRAAGFEPFYKPKGFLFQSSIKQPNRIALHLSVGPHALYQRHIHPKARQFYPEHRESLQNYIKDNQDKFEFIEYGTEFSGMEGVINRCGLKLESTIKELSECNFFIGLHSGVMHLAIALGLKCIIIINFPNPKELYLPALKDLPIEDLHWLYPQAVHLHEDSDGELVKEFSYKNIEKAINGDIYPYWSDKYLNLIDAFK